ncbi:MAG: amino acid ABC transporter ATP-binding protein [Lentisphaeria bacterium]|nr:amino acid ABC transporter ATP-binding protein [Lentisphaeria bacterium]
MQVLQISDLSKKFGSKAVLHNISMNVAQGEVVAIIGPSGSGKTTLLRCATMLEKADTGKLQFGDDTVICAGTPTAPAVLKNARRKCGMVFQNFNLFPHMSVLDNIIDAPIHVHHVSRTDAIAEALQLLEKMNLADRAQAYPCELSGGQQQRVAIARALALHPDILFFDEPTSALDPELTKEVLRVIRKLAEENMTMVIVTHEMEFAAAVADRIVFMADGVIVEEGEAKALINDPQQERTKAFLSGIRN